jgi:hypothetical protein
MPKLANKHANAELVTFADFSGGLNLALPPESISNGELQEAVNLEFESDTGALKVRGGLAPVHEFDEPVTDIVNTADGSVLLVRAGNVYQFNTAVYGITDLGAVDGDKPASAALWDEKNVAVCFGGHIYLYEPTGALTQIDTEDAPAEAEILYVRGGRVCVASAGSDTIRVSAVGDASNWIEDSEDDSTAKRLDIGYKDGRDIRAIAATLGTILVFKCPEGQPERGRIYRLQGDFPDWAVTPYSEGESAWNAQSVANVGNDIMFLTREGMANISSVTEYGDFKLGWAGAKVNPRMSARLTALCSLQNVPEKSQLWVMDGVSGDVWVYHYSIGEGAWTTFSFGEAVTAVGSSNGVTFVALGTKLYRMDDLLEFDYGNGTHIDCRLKPKTIMRRNQVLLKQIMVRFDTNEDSEIHVRVENMRLIIKYDESGHEAFSDDEDAYTDNEPLVPPPIQKAVRRRCNIRRWAITPEVVVIVGAFSMTLMELEIAEV